MSAIDDANNYIGAAFGPTYSAWMVLSDDDKGRTLVSATRYLNELPWQGAPTGVLDSSATTLAWPRTGVLIDGAPVDSTTIPNDIVQACFELAVLISAKPAVTSLLDQGSNIQSVGGGGAPSVSYFAPTSAARGTAPTLPVVVARLVSKYLATPGDAADGGSGTSGNTCSGYARARQFSLVFPE